MSNFAIYSIGFVFLIAGLAWAAHTVGVPPLWIGIGAVVMGGIGLITGVKNTRLKESSETDDSSNRVVVQDSD